MKILQITSVVENYETESGKTLPELEATVYGLGDDQKLYYWAEVEKSKGFSFFKKDTKEEPEMEMGWKSSGS